MTITRRQLAHGTLWSAPVILASAAAPAMAVSPCALYKLGGVLPASAFTLTYMRITSESFGDGTDKAFAVQYGFRISDEARSCGLRTGSISTTTGRGTSTARVGTQTTYTITPLIGSLNHSGTVGSQNLLCEAGATRTEVCSAGGTIGDIYRLLNSPGTVNRGVTQISLNRQISVTGYAPTTVNFLASFSESSSYPHVGTNLRVTAGG